MTGNEIGLIGSLVIFGLIGFLNVVKYKKFINDFFEPTTMYSIFIFLFFTLNFYLGDVKFLKSTSFIFFIGSIFFVLGYYSKTYKIFNWIKNGFRYSTIKRINTNKYIFYTLIISLTNVFVFYLKARSYGVSIYEFISNIMKIQGQFKVGGYIWLALSYPLSAIQLLNTFRYCENKKKINIIVIFIMQLIFSISTLSGSRFTHVVNVIFIPWMLFSIFYKGKPIFKFKHIILGVAILPLMFALNQLRHGYKVGEIDTQTIIRSVVSDTNPGRNFNEMVKYLHRTNNYDFGRFFFLQFISIIPRKLWISKPITSLNFYYTQEIMGIDPVVDGTTMTFTLFDSYAILSYPMLLIFQYLIGAIMRLFYKELYAEKKNFYLMLFTFPLILNFINSLRASIIDQISFFMLFVIIIWFLYKSSIVIKIIKK